MKYYIYFFVACFISIIFLSFTSDKQVVLKKSDKNFFCQELKKIDKNYFFQTAQAQITLPYISGIDSTNNVIIDLQKIDKPVTPKDILIYSLSFIFSLFSIFLLRWFEYLLRKKLKK